MKRILLGILLGWGLAATPALALRLSRPPIFTQTEWTMDALEQLNDTLLQLWNVTNGRVSIDRVTADPDGSRACSVGEQVFYDTGTDQLCICAVEATRKWNCVNLS